MKDEFSVIESEKALKKLETSSEGLKKNEAKARLEKDGLNKLVSGKGPSATEIFANQFKNFLILILFAALFLSAFLGKRMDAIAIVFIIILNTMLGFIQEYKAEKAIDALMKMVTPSATVFRDGKKKKIPAENLVKGDIIWLESGDRVPADARIISQSDLYVDESALTGESTPVSKTEKLLDAPGTENYIFMSTNVMRGSCKAVVFSTGMETEIGQIAEMVQELHRERTPLQDRLDSFGKFLGLAALAICTLMFLIGIFRGEPLVDMLLTATSLAVSAIPAGLPAVVTIGLAVGVQRMIKKNVIIRRLSAVEALGSTSIICTDKTGTLTMNEMTVSQIFVGGKRAKVTGVGYEPKGEFKYHEEKLEKDELELLLKIGALCNSAHLEKEKDEWKILGDATEGALLVSARKAGIDERELKKELKLIDDFPFDSERKMMSVVFETENGMESYVKGAPEMIVAQSDRIYDNGKIRKMTERDRKSILEENHLMAEDALRVLGLAFKKLSKRPKKGEDAESDLIFVGLQGMIDRPRPEVEESLRICKSAGLKVIMVTGDHKVTATAIGNELGLLDGGEIVDGNELREMSDEELFERVENINIYARVMPEEKIRIVKAWQKKGKVVTMTGDGVNDAPALKGADVGVAMGITGTDVSKEASDMILIDDNFASIVSAVEEGRGIYDNIQKFLNLILGTNVGELLTMLVSIFIGLPIPLLPIQILWTNLVTDGFPAIALSIDPIDKDVMKREPREKEESIISDYMKHSISLTGIWMAIGTILAFIYATNSSNIEYARTFAFTVLVFFQLFRALAVRNETKTLFEIGVFSNPHLILGVLVSAVLQLVVVYYHPLQPLFGTVSLTPLHFFYSIALTSTIFIISEVDKIWKRERETVSG